MKITVYVEGGGDNNALRTKCREGFSEFFRKAGLAGRMPKIVACGSRNDAYARFCIAVKNDPANEFIVLLVDSEAAVESNAGSWRHLKLRDRWDQPATAIDEQAHLMVECMENWLLADPQVLGHYYAKNFNFKALPTTGQIEQVTKADLFTALKRATQNTQKGTYSKGSHSFELLGKIDPHKVIAKAPYAQRLIAILLEKSSQ